MAKTFKRPVVTREALDHITSQQLQTVPPAAPAPSGGPSPRPAETPPETERPRGRPRRTVDMVTFNLRLPADVVAQIDRVRGGLVSRNGWIGLAIGEKLKKAD